MQDAKKKKIVQNVLARSGGKEGLERETKKK